MTTSIGKNTASGVISSIFQVATRLITVPVVISHLGIGGYGVWSVVMTVAAYMRFGSMGVKFAFQKYVAEATGSGGYRRASILLSTGCTGMFALSLLGLAPIALLSRNIASLSGVPKEFLGSAAAAWSVLAVTMLVANTGAAYEAVVMGGHRIDLARRFNTILCVLEAVAIVAVVKSGYGLFAMASIMGVSEVIFIICCKRASGLVMPQIKISPVHFDSAVLPELIRFAGSYQLVSILQLISGAVVPVVVLRAFGANAAGVFALAGRLAWPITMCVSAFLVPVLSSGAMLHATGKTEGMSRLVSTSFRIILAATVIPSALLAGFGPSIITMWTGQSDIRLGPTIWILCSAGVFQAISLLGLVLYRASGRALGDIARETARMAVLLVFSGCAARIGFSGLLSGLAVAELVGMIVMVFAMARVFDSFRAVEVLECAARLTISALGILAVGLAAAHIVPSTQPEPRTLSAIRLGVGGIAVLASAYPILRFTRSLSDEEARRLSCLLKGQAPWLFRFAGI